MRLYRLLRARLLSDHQSTESYEVLWLILFNVDININLQQKKNFFFQHRIGTSHCQLSPVMCVCACNFPFFSALHPA